jgi:ABC-2 type transport system ATP-binding protein
MRKVHDKRYKQELVDKFELDPSKKAGTYSKGNRQKVALVAAFSAEAELYILDEPTSGLDPLMERVFQDCVAQAKAEGKSILLSSHILSEVEQLCDKLSIIRQGKIIDSGTLQDLRHLSRNNVTIETVQTLDALSSLSGVYNVTQDNQNTRFKIDNDQMDTVMAYLSSKGIKRLEIVPPTLEELFMSHYAGTD